MTNAERACRARVAFAASDHSRQDNDPITNLYDLICDLLHLADTTDDPAYLPVCDSGSTVGAWVAHMALYHYRAELDEERAEDEETLIPPPDLADAWKRYQFGGDVTQSELRALDEWRIDVAWEQQQ